MNTQTPAYPLVKFYAGEKEIFLPVRSVAGGFARGPDGCCAFCHGDPCNEDSPEDSPIAEFYADDPGAETCPVCAGRAS